MKHLQDNTKPFGLLSEEEQEYLRGLDFSELEVFYFKEWVRVLNKPLWDHVAYRVKPQPLTKPSIDWSHVHEDYNWLATDKYGATFLYTDKPKIYISYNQFKTKGFATCISSSAFASFKKGTCDWADSLVQRPKGNT